MPYVLWTAAFNTSFILGYLLVQLAFSVPAGQDDARSADKAPVSGKIAGLPPLLQAANRNALVVFLSVSSPFRLLHQMSTLLKPRPNLSILSQANLLTGLVNVSTNTLESGSGMAFGMLCGYGAVVYALAWLLRRKKVL